MTKEEKAAFGRQTISELDMLISEFGKLKRGIENTPALAPIAYLTEQFPGAISKLENMRGELEKMVEELEK